ncbi:aminoglycoside phosphotransferase family protein [Sulfitobacter sp. SK012]|uniref:aminoglycoside phosphotransferase family protein n=1 Tax=Sulfitobacter sp. SK012 TaxID=1389005 RepID=UPI0015756046|nr:phosphotransferase [Sulfitobacter sp. SK012]
MLDRSCQINQFVTASGWGNTPRRLVAGDASNRRYERLEKADGSTLILMDAPTEKGEDIRPFVAIARHLRAMGLSAPEIHFSDTDLGLLLIEDLGDALFARVVQATPTMERPIYDAAIDVLTAQHAAPAPDLAPYDAATMTPLAALAFHWYQLGTKDALDQTTLAEFEAKFRALLSPLDTAQRVLIQRDFHAENLLWLPDRKGVARVGLLDFQDAMSGHPAYDLVSVLQDARRDVDPELERAMIERYLDQNPQDRDAFISAYALLGLQRNLRILGVFARLCMRDGKAHYVDLIPRVWGHIQTNLRHPALGSLRPLIDTLPAPTEKILERLKAKCATVQKL